MCQSDICGRSRKTGSIIRPVTTCQQLVTCTHDASLELALWMTEQGISVKELAARIGCTPDAVTRWRTRASRPSREMAVALERITEGRVTVDRWSES